MSKRQILMIIGVWVMGFLFLGFPASLDKVLSVITGLVLILLAYSVRSEQKKSTVKDLPFVEHKTESMPPTKAESELVVDKPIESVIEDKIS